MPWKEQLLHLVETASQKDSVFTDLFILVLAETGIDKCFPTVVKNKCPWVLVQVMQEKTTERSDVCAVCYLSSGGLRE